MQKKHNCLSKVPNKLPNWGPEIDPKSMKIQAWTPRSPFLCSQVPLDRRMVTQGAKVEALPTAAGPHSRDEGCGVVAVLCWFVGLAGFRCLGNSFLC